MITIKYEKKEPSIYVSHIDLLRQMARIVRRTGYMPEFSKGFNPHMLLFFSPPIAVGVSSECEYVSIDIRGVSGQDFLDAFNRSVPLGIKGVKYFETEKAPNLAGRIVSSDYFFPVSDNAKAKEVEEYFKTNTSFTIEYVQKNESIVKDVGTLVKGVKAVDGGLICTLGTGNENLRADRFLAGLKKQFSIDTSLIDVVKITQYLFDGKVISVDEVLDRG